MNEITAQKPLILNFDQSVHLASAQTIELTQWQESIRFGASMKNFDALRQALNHQMPDQYGPVFMGSGDYHHITLLLLERLLAKQSNNHIGASTDRQPIDFIVFDNHPDNMRFPFGIHCGSWVFHAAKLPQIRHIHVIGITSNDIGFAHAIENHFRPLYRNKLIYWSMQVNTQWAHSIGLKKAFKSFASPDQLIDCFLQTMKNETHNLYLSIDKDAFSRDVIQTNWDQGILEEHHLWQVIDQLKSHIIAADITGEVSEYHYQTPWKRFLSKLDQQAPIPQESLATWQAQQNAFNTRIIEQLK